MYLTGAGLECAWRWRNRLSPFIRSAAQPCQRLALFPSGEKSSGRKFIDFESPEKERGQRLKNSFASSGETPLLVRGPAASALHSDLLHHGAPPARRAEYFGPL